MAKVIRDARTGKPVSRETVTARLGEITKAQLDRFVKRRNRSDFDSNLQFQIDANATGFTVDALSKPQKFTLDGFRGYQWKVPTKNAGTIRLVEFGRQLHLQTDPSTAELFEMMNRAVFVGDDDQPIDKSGLTGL